VLKRQAGGSKDSLLMIRPQAKVQTHYMILKEVAFMTIIQLYTLLEPLIQVLGTLCLIALLAGGMLFAMVWIAKRYWKQILTFGAVSFVLMVVVLVVGAI
jgi:ABC-type maltose transport system permease subunit